MFGYKDFSPLRKQTADLVACPLAGCETLVPRQRGKFVSSDTFLCERHQIYIGPTTFEYRDYKENLLWKNDSDIRLLSAIKGVKRESRMERERSEDAVTWNIFRYLDNEKQLTSFLH